MIDADGTRHANILPTTRDRFQLGRVCYFGSLEHEECRIYDDDDTPLAFCEQHDLPVVNLARTDAPPESLWHKIKSRIWGDA
jgi:hypothetical protein